jgi:hypothetical protein
LYDLDKQIAGVQKKISEQRKKMGGVNATNENNKVSFTYFIYGLASSCWLTLLSFQLITKQIKILENRLDQVFESQTEIITSKTFHPGIDEVQ